MGQCIKCGAKFIGTAANPPKDGLCRYCEMDSLRSLLTAANKRIEELEKILKRFADYMPKIDPDWQNAHILLGGRFTDGPIIVAGDFREASRVLKGEKDQAKND